LSELNFWLTGQDHSTMDGILKPLWKYTYWPRSSKLISAKVQIDNRQWCVHMTTYTAHRKVCVYPCMMCSLSSSLVSSLASGHGTMGLDMASCRPTSIWLDRWQAALTQPHSFRHTWVATQCPLECMIQSRLESMIQSWLESLIDSQFERLIESLLESLLKSMLKSRASERHVLAGVVFPQES